MIALSENDVQRLELKLSEMKTEIIQKIDSIALDQVKNYVSKKECTNCKTEQGINRRSGISNTIMGAGIFVTLVIGIIGLFK